MIVDRKVSTDQYTTFVSTDHTWLAATGLEKLVELIGGRGKIAIIEGLPGAGPAVERNTGYGQVLSRYSDIEAIRQAGDWSRASQPFLPWTDGYNGGLKLIKAGIGKFSIQHRPRLHGKRCVESLIRILRGEKVPKDQPMKLDFITPENVDEYVALDKPDDYWAM